MKDSLFQPTGKVLTIFGNKYKHAIGWIQSKLNLKSYILDNVAEMHEGGNVFFQWLDRKSVV